MPLPKVSTAIDPSTGRRIVPYAPLTDLVSFDPTEEQNEPEEDDVDIDADVPDISLPPEPVEATPTEEQPPLDTVASSTPMDSIWPRNVSVPPAVAQTIWNPWFPQLSRPEPNLQTSAWQIPAPAAFPTGAAAILFAPATGPTCPKLYPSASHRGTQVAGKLAAANSSRATEDAGHCFGHTAAHRGYARNSSAAR
jgi:hypothetical protein